MTQANDHQFTRRRVLQVAGGGAAGAALLGAAGCGGDDNAGAQTPEKETTGALEVPGARLYYEVRGVGPLLVVVAGRKGNADPYRQLASELSTRYQVVTYDRRGFSRSQLVDTQDYDRRLATDADDVRRLIEHLSDEPATVFGTSSGAVVALEVLILHPDVVRTDIAHEPPMNWLLPDGEREQQVAGGDALYNTYRTSGVVAAVKQFAEKTGIGGGTGPAPSGSEAAAGEPCSYDVANDTYWLEREMRQYPRTELDVEALATRADRLVLVGGRESPRNGSYRPNTVLAAMLGKTVVDLPGGHLGMVQLPAEFARELLDVLGR